jgi:hypothetical protein
MRPRQTSLPPRFPVALSKPLARLDHLHNVDVLLQRHNRRRSQSQDPREGRVHFVRASHLHSACRPRACEEYRGLWGGGRAGLDRSWDLLVTQKGGREERRGEGEQVEGDEEQFVHGAEGEEDFLCDR